MPLTHFLSLIIMVMLAGGVTVALALWANLPLLAFGFAAVAGSLILGWNRVGR